MKKQSLRDIAAERRAKKQNKYALIKEREAFSQSGSIVTMEVYKFDLNLFLNRGWKLIDSTPSSYGAAQKYMLQIDALTLKERLK